MKNEEKDAVLRMSVAAMIIFLILGGVMVAVGMMNPREDLTKGIEALKRMEEVDAAENDVQIQVLEEAEQAADEAWANRSPEEKFVDAMILGDSIAEGLDDYDILPRSCVTAESDTGVCVSEVSMIENHVSYAIERSPKVLFLSYGLNDIEAASGDADVFIKAYRKVLDQLKEQLPDTKIYINSILPVRKTVVEEDEQYEMIPQYNKELMALCEEEQIVFIDNTSFVKDEDYQEDGIHVTEDYYTDWVDRMAETAEL